MSEERRLIITPNAEALSRAISNVELPLALHPADSFRFTVKTNIHTQESGFFFTDNDFVSVHPERDLAAVFKLLPDISADDAEKIIVSINEKNRIRFIDLLPGGTTIHGEEYIKIEKWDDEPPPPPDNYMEPEDPFIPSAAEGSQPTIDIDHLEL